MISKARFAMLKVSCAVLAGAALVAHVGAALAHHSYAMWNHNKVLTVSGTIGAIQWMNPHVWVWVYVPKEQGGYDLYGFESNTVANISRLGWHKDSLKVGDVVSVGDTAASQMIEPSKQSELEMVPPKDITPPD